MQDLVKVAGWWMVSIKGRAAASDGKTIVAMTFLWRRRREGRSRSAGAGKETSTVTVVSRSRSESR